MSSRARRLAKAIARQIADEPLPDLRWEPVVPTKPVEPYAENPSQIVYCDSAGETRTRDAGVVLVRPEVSLLFVAPITADGPDRQRLEGLAEACVDLLAWKRLEGYSLEQIVTETSWDPEADAAGRFAALYRLVYATACTA